MTCESRDRQSRYAPLMATTGTERFPIRLETWYRIMSSALLLPPSTSYVDVKGDDVLVRMGWAFSARFPRSSVAGMSQLDGAPLSRGVHGFAGRWLVNGSGDRILVLDLQPIQRARLLGFPICLQQLMVSVDDPDLLARRIQK